jgi:hypothetical protein
MLPAFIVADQHTDGPNVERTVYFDRSREVPLRRACSTILVTIETELVREEGSAKLSRSYLREDRANGGLVDSAKEGHGASDMLKPSSMSPYVHHHFASRGMVVRDGLA